MKRLLLLVPKCDGPSKNKRWNECWPNDIENAVTQKYDLAAMYTVTPNIKRAYELAKYYKTQGTYVVLGGVHATVCPDEASGYADTVLIGEVEYTWPAFLKDFQLDAAKKTYSQPLEEVNINCSPVPSFHLLPKNARKLIPIQTARGCPHGCKFCNLRSLYGKQYRAKKIENVEREIAAVKKINPYATVYFTDDNLFCNRTHAELLMQKVGEYNLTWYANTDISFGSDTEFIKMAYRSGCRQVLIGLESVNSANLKGLDESNFKIRSFTHYKDLIENIQSCGIGVVGSFILGLDEDDEDVFDKTIKFILNTKLYGANVTVNTPYPGTVNFKAMSAENRILTYDWNCYTIFNPVIIPKKMTVEKLNEGYLKVLKTINSPECIKNRVNYFKEKMRNRER